MIKLFVIACLLERCLAKDLKIDYYYHITIGAKDERNEGISSMVTFNKCCTNLEVTEST